MLKKNPLFKVGDVLFVGRNKIYEVSEVKWSGKRYYYLFAGYNDPVFEAILVRLNKKREGGDNK